MLQTVTHKYITYSYIKFFAIRRTYSNYVSSPKKSDDAILERNIKFVLVESNRVANRNRSVQSQLQCIGGGASDKKELHIKQMICKNIGIGSDGKAIWKFTAVNCSKEVIPANVTISFEGSSYPGDIYVKRGSEVVRYDLEFADNKFPYWIFALFIGVAIAIYAIKQSKHDKKNPPNNEVVSNNKGKEKHIKKETIHVIHENKVKETPDKINIIHVIHENEVKEKPTKKETIRVIHSNKKKQGNINIFNEHSYEDDLTNYNDKKQRSSYKNEIVYDAPTPKENLKSAQNYTTYGKSTDSE